MEEVRQALRSLGRDRRFTAVAVLVLALGIAGNTLVFSLVNALVLNPFPYPAAERLFEIKSGTREGEWSSTVRVADFAYWREHARSYDEIAAYGYTRSNLTAQSLPGFQGPERVVTGTATESFLRALGVVPALGRFFSEAEDRPGGAPIVVLSHGAWARRFGRSPGVLGETLTLDGTARTIVGVMPASLHLPGMFTCELWVPAAYDVAANMRPGYDTRYDGDHAIARLGEGVALEAAQAELDVLVARLEHELPRRSRNWRARLEPLGEDVAQVGGEGLRLLALVVGTGLLLACANLAGLLLARSGARARETAVRASLGAGRWRLVRGTLTETAILSLAGGCGGLALASWGIRAAATAAPPFMGLDSALRIDGPVLAFTLGLSLATGLAFGLVPALKGSKADLASMLKGASRPSRAGGALISALVVSEVALALVLLVGGGLMARGFAALAAVDTGIRADGVLTFRLDLAGERYRSDARRAEFLDALLERLAVTPGVVAAAAISPLPMSREYSGGGFAIEGRPVPADRRQMSAQYCAATPGYFRAMGVPVLAGREFEDADGSMGPVVVVNRALAKRFFPGENPLGRRLIPFGLIVGVVGDIRHDGPARPVDPQIYTPFARRPPRSFSVAAATTADPLALVPAIRQQVRVVDPDLPVDRPRAMSDVEWDSMADARLMATAVAGFAAFALALASLGLYGVIAYGVTRRQQEMGIRMALGATRGQVLSLVLSRGVRLAAAGIATGIPAAFASARLLSSFLYGVAPHDAAVFTAVPAVLVGVALLASYLPARRAAGADPVASLRSE